MNPNIGIKSYFQPQKQAFPTCHVCGKNVRFPATCDNCHNVVCNRHRPAFVKPWYCDKCLGMWNQWAQNNPNDQSGAQIINQTVTAENFYSSHRIAEAEQMIDHILNNIMTDNRKGMNETSTEIINTEHGDTVNG